MKKLAPWQPELPKLFSRNSFFRDREKGRNNTAQPTTRQIPRNPRYLFKMAMVVAKNGEEKDYSIKPEAVTPTLDTSTWPLLLKNYDKREYNAILGSIDDAQMVYE